MDILEEIVANKRVEIARVSIDSGAALRTFK